MNALVTGGSRGIGAAIVRNFRAAGWPTCFLYASSHNAADTLAKETGALAFSADVSNREQTVRAIRKAEEAFGRIDVLVNNAGISSFCLFQDVTEEAWQQMLNVNLSGAYRCIQAVLPGMISRKQGKIINISSVWGITGASCEVAYSAAKAGLIGLTKALAKELGPSGITVNCVAPGVIDTEMNYALSEQARAELCQETPLRRMGTAKEVAQAVFFLAGETGNFWTGQVLSPNGGFLI